ncbi:MAG TPA: single-stranded-DNA-specific exonuclease RecJ [Candidatus Babeliales bacterium]|jgi:single-stranded-DNA-specific exonuclease|nr:single-stranded-DNA-specific exonuclease RecJ [Candidatus Babeliales bacterium]
MKPKTIQGEKYVWFLPDEHNARAAQIASSYNLSIPIAQTLLSRGFTSKEMIDDFLFSTYQKDVGNSKQMKDAQKAVDRIVHAIKSKEKIIICGDYDVDGVTSSALMMMCLLPLGADVNFFLPHRVKNGYGLSTNTVQKAADSGYTLMITVDNGITAFEPALLAKKLGIDLIITDHHKPHDHLPEAFAIVNPNQQDCTYPYKLFAGVGVAFKIVSLLYEHMGKELPCKAYELLLLGTIADVVPLTGENRFWVRYGLSTVHQMESLSFKALKQNGKLSKPTISATDIAFSIAPQINALGRLEDARQGVRFLIGSDKQEVDSVAAMLLSLNETRKTMERAIFEEVVQHIESGIVNLQQERCIIASSSHWPPGVIGLVASRIMAAYGRPTILLHETKENIFKGSCRSIPEFDIFTALSHSRDILIQFGGHPAAAGLSIDKENLPILKQRLEALLAQQVTEYDLLRKLKLDASAQLSDLTHKFITDMVHLEPFGHGNSTPCFYIHNVVQVQKPLLLKDLHIKMSIFADGVIKPVILFNRPELYEKLIVHAHSPLSIAAHVTGNYWNGRTNIELTGIDVAFGEQ